MWTLDHQSQCIQFACCYDCVACWQLLLGVSVFTSLSAVCVSLQLWRDSVCCFHGCVCISLCWLVCELFCVNSCVSHFSCRFTVCWINLAMLFIWGMYCRYVHMYVCMCIHIHIHIHTTLSLSPCMQFTNVNLLFWSAQCGHNQTNTLFSNNFCTHHYNTTCFHHSHVFQHCSIHSYVITKHTMYVSLSFGGTYSTNAIFVI